ncbi:carboxylate--amine ligase/circularly permuted type 2 ATP-grasp protein [Actinocorallia sp. A-T 12471]|uniref:carboxylate--amine ligase/circularly permuted type 2 ATP-grasp protein n=1 Tax=Actinocorallia sp. A-T 12471 TaxID=3089813 RepID=UPI0029D19570|nr:carboxylate--amine ligase/circularly permuted type 2 ATP-grasp protein [Actinocorallia sp. A-T 12471]MDX6740138.1 carboxylate--amine ligase/circularly permuted type 2 ATP-grasp protein [Actinocorallia sp. A-T 12471]
MQERPESVAVGVEEEFHLVDLRTRRLVPRADALLGTLKADRFSSELQRSVVETNSRPFVGIADLVEDLAALRRGVVEEAERFGLGAVAAGTVPIVDMEALDVTPDARYENMLEEYQVLAREQLICGAQVHVEVADRDLAVRVAHRIAPWTPVLLALSASSPFWLGEDTGYASARTLLWSRWPTTGPAPQVDTAREYDELVTNLIRTGVITDPGMIYYDLRPSSHLPTLELRVPDACPRIDDVALLAGLFRALVVAELQAIEADRPALASRPELVRAHTWRAAREGLEGELVDPVIGRPFAATRVVHGLLDRLRPVLEESGDWDLMAELTHASLERGSSAARQRAAFAAGGPEDVVDLLIAETRMHTDSGPATERTEVMEMLRGYDSSADEAIVFDRTARRHYGLILTAFDRLGPEGVAERERRRDDVQRRLGMFFRTDEEEDRLFPFDLFPRIVAGQDWRAVSTGLAQRARALEAFLNDAYGDREIVRDGIVPGALLDTSPGTRPEGGLVAPGTVRCAVTGTDLVRTSAGRWFVLEDNLRVPSGIGYAMANRWLAARVLPELVRAAPTSSPRRAVAVLRDALTHQSRALALVTEGQTDAAYYEHKLLASELGVPLVTPADLRVDGKKRVFAGDAPVEVLYRRIEERELFDSVPGLRDALAAGTITLANAPGNGLGDDKALYAHVPDFISYYLDETPILDNVPTFLCRNPDSLTEVLDRLGELVLKPVEGFGGRGVVIGPDASAEELAEVRALITADPAGWIAQETIELSTHPTFEGKALEPRAVDLRAFVCMGAETEVVPLALTRVAPAGSRIVNSSRGGGSKDTWLLS